MPGLSPTLSITRAKLHAMKYLAERFEGRSCGEAPSDSARAWMYLSLARELVAEAEQLYEFPLLHGAKQTLKDAASSAFSHFYHQEVGRR